jgi:hypothetical protein
MRGQADYKFQPLDLQDNEMPIGVDHRVAANHPLFLQYLQDNEMPIGVDSELDRNEYCY